MAFEIRQSEGPQRALRRLARERIAKAISSIEAARTEDADRSHINKAVHDARKRCKELRGLLRLVRPAMSDYKAENAAFRDAARVLADLRDAQTLVETFDGVIQDAGLEQDRFASIREEIARDRASEVGDADARLAEFVSQMTAVRERCQQWKLDENGFDAYRGGLEKIFGGCREGMAEARRAATAENLHEWRKQVKYNRYHLRLLRGMWKPVIEPLREQAKALGDALGDEHDLALLASVVEQRCGDDQNAAALLKHIESKRTEHRASAFALGGKLYAQGPRAYSKHAKRLFRAWQGPSPQQ